MAAISLAEAPVANYAGEDCLLPQANSRRGHAKQSRTLPFDTEPKCWHEICAITMSHEGESVYGYSQMSLLTCHEGSLKEPKPMLP